MSGTIFCRNATKSGRVRDLANRHLFHKFVNFGPVIRRDAMRRHASVLHWCTC